MGSTTETNEEFREGHIASIVFDEAWHAPLVTVFLEDLVHISPAISRLAKNAMKNNEPLIVKLAEPEVTTAAMGVQDESDEEEFERDASIKHLLQSELRMLETSRPFLA